MTGAIRLEGEAFPSLCFREFCTVDILIQSGNIAVRASGKEEKMLKFNQPVQTYDVALLLKGEHGTFLVQRAGQTAIVQAKEGHSIASWTPVGSIESTNVNPGSNPPYTCTRIDEMELDSEGGTQQQNRR